MENMGIVNLSSVYKGKKVFITGHTGFKGSWLLTWLHSLEAIIKGYSLSPINDFDLYNQIEGNSLCESVIADVRDKEQLKKEILDFQPDFIFHLAAQPLVRLSYETPLDTFEINTLGTAYVLDAIRFLEKPCIAVMITTDKVYENNEIDYPYQESDRLGGHDPYSASKATAELIINSYRSSFFNLNYFESHKKAIASARAGNVIGGGDWSKDRIIPDLIRALKNNVPIEIRNPNSVRPWQHVIEPINGYLLLGAKLSENPIEYSEAWNFGPMQDNTFTVEDLVKKAIGVWGEGNYVKPILDNQLHEAGWLKLDINKSINNLGWKPKWNAIETIKKTIEFYKFNGENVLTVLNNQIKNYQE
jgi:CDP-glucose 4,6-dehydratase